jgi:hypothetical protein
VRSKGMLIMAAVAGILSLVATPASMARADVVAQLPIKNEYQVVADTAHGHLFISQGTFTLGQGSYNDDYILVTDLNGSPVATIDNEGGVEGMALSPDGSTLYAALTTGDAVSAISTTTLTETARYPVGFPAYSVAVQSGRIWVSFRDTAAAVSEIGAIDPANVNSFAPAVPDNWPGLPPQIAADPSDTGVLLTSSVGTSPPTVASFNVSNPAAVTMIASSEAIGGCPAWHGLAVAPGGATFLCDGVPYSTADMSQQGYLWAGAVAAIAPNGTVAAGNAETSQNPTGAPDLYIYPSATAGSYQTAYSLEGPNSYLTDLTWSADSSRLFAVIASTDSSGTPVSYTLRGLYPPRASTTLTLSGPASGKGDGSATLTGELTANLAPLAGAKVTVTRTGTGTATERLTTTTSANGTFTVHDAYPKVTSYTYTAGYAGDAANAPATAAPVTVTATRITAALALSSNTNPAGYGARVTVTAHLGTTYTGRTVSIYATPADGAKKLLKTGKVSASGNLAVGVALTRATTFSAVFPGDARYAPRTVTLAVGVQAKVTAALGGYFTSTRIAGTVYRVYHHTATLKDSVTVTPNKRGQCVELQVQKYSADAWHTSATTDCAALNSASKATLSVKLSANARYRVRAYYVHSSKDTTNVSTYGAWLYYQVVK